MQRNQTANWKDVLSVDFTTESKKREETKQALLRHISRQGALKPDAEKENFTMKQTGKRHFKRTTAVALAACMAVVLSISAFAIVNYFNLGQHAQYIFTPDTTDNKASPSDLQGLEKTGGNDDSGYSDRMSTLFDKLDDAQSYLAFDALSFTYVPADYVLDGYRIYNDESGQPQQDTKYLQMNFHKSDDSGDTIFVQARLMDEETAFTYESSSGGKVEQTTINGHEAILYDNSVSILMDNVIYTVSAENLPQIEVKKMAESLAE